MMEEDIEIDINSSIGATNEENRFETGEANEILNANKENSNQKQKLVRLPVTRVKAMMKKDPSCTLVSQDAVFLVTKATEMFIEYIAKETGKHLGAGKRKTVMRRDVDYAIDTCSQLCFLDGALD